MKDLFRAGLIGLGRMASWIGDDDPSGFVISHAAALGMVPGFSLVAGCDPTEEQRRNFAQRWNVQALYASAEEMIEQAGLDLVIIASPAACHREHLLAAARGRPKAIFCEKPLCESTAEADEGLRACAAAGIPVAVNHSRRWSAVYQEARRLIQDGALGRLVKAVSYYGGGVSNIGTHILDVLRFLCGDVIEVQALIPATAEADPDIDARLAFSNGCHGYFVSNASRSFIQIEFDIIGEAGRLRITGNGFLLEYFRADGESRKLVLERTFEKDPAERPLIASLEQLHAIMSGSGEKPLCDGDDGLKALEIACAARISAESGMCPVSLPLTNRTYRLQSRSRGLATPQSK